MTGVYRPAEDSYLLLEQARGRVCGSVLDMGTGSGLLAVELASKKCVSSVVAIDLDTAAVTEARRRAEDAGVADRIEFVVSDLFDELEDRRFDWIVFNPPYLPSEGSIDEASWAGGRVGGEVVMRFLHEAPDHLEPKGRILLILSSLTGVDLEKLRDGFRVEVVGEEPLFYERLQCLMLEPINPSEGPGRDPR
ncbi:MAG: methyltransferase [Candidatus Bathyarchaeota archaeon]|nr:MAG: methyltransferase [Candidatus Bathyarchaeota archaeon]